VILKNTFFSFCKFRRKFKPISTISTQQRRRRVNNEIKEFHSLNMLPDDFTYNQIITELIETRHFSHTKIPLNQNLSNSEPIIESVYYSGSIHINRNLNEQKPTDFGNELAFRAIEENIYYSENMIVLETFFQ